MNYSFSVLMAIYSKDDPDYFHRAMLSIWNDQTIKPNEIILVEDGPLTDDLYRRIKEWKKELGDIFKIISLKKNMGLGDALNAGLKECSNELVARMDSDDISLPNRFDRQLEVFKGYDIDICSALISEFEGSEENIISYRRVPERHDSIIKYAKIRSPINHIPVMFKKSIVEKAGGYKKMMWLEDYYLWVRLIMNNAKFYNIQEVLANIRSGYEQLERRRGIKYAKSEFALQKEFLRLGFINYFEFIRNISIRFTARIVPKKLVKLIYKQLRN